LTLREQALQIITILQDWQTKKLPECFIISSAYHFFSFMAKH